MEKRFAKAEYPTIYSDIPDPDIICVGDTFYMVSTTMHLCPGVPVMKSKDLIHWQIVNYVYETFEDDDITNLANGKHMYSHGSWAASLKYEKETGLFYVAFNSNDHGFYIYTTKDIENGLWTKHSIKRAFHDPALLIENGLLFVISASGDTCILQEFSLNKDNRSVETIGEGHVLFKKPVGWGLWEGAHAYHIEDYYYVFIIASPKDRWMRTEVCYRAKNLSAAKWEEQIVYCGGSGKEGAGLAQGGLVQAPTGKWYGFLFQDRGSFGRVPSIIDVQWEDGFPIMGTYDQQGNFRKSYSEEPITIRLNEDQNGNRFICSDDFDYKEGEKLNLCWQWNHNPKPEFVSLTARPGFLRVTTDSVVEGLWEAHNTLTQRTLGPNFASEIMLETDHMKPGDFAGLAASADHAAAVGVMCDEKGERYIFQGYSEFLKPMNIICKLSTSLSENQPVFLRAVYTSRDVIFKYSLDGTTWEIIGEAFHPSFSIYTTFMGIRSWLFNYATKAAGGFADFDYYYVATYENGDPNEIIC